MKLLFVTTLLLASFANAKSVTCDIDEQVDQKVTKSQVILPISEELSARVVTFFGVIKLNFAQDTVTVALPEDAGGKALIQGQMSSRDGDLFRFQSFPYEGKDDYIDVVCTMAGEAQPQMAPSAANCTLSETDGSRNEEQTFTVPMAQNGHEVFAIPEGKLGSLAGWVVLYKGVLVSYMQNHNEFTSVSGISAWDKDFKLRWMSAKNIWSELKCTPTF